MALTTAQKTELERVSSPHALLSFIRISHSSLTEDIRIVNDVLNFVRGGEEWTAISDLDPRLVSDSDGIPRTVLSVPNVDRRIGEALLATSERARVSVEVLSSEDFDLSVDPRQEVGTAAVYHSYLDFELLDASVDDLQVEATIILRDYSQEPWPFVRATEDRLPGLFA